PAKVLDSLINMSALKPDLVRGTDLVIVRELMGGIYFGNPRGIFAKNGERMGINTEVYREHEVERIAHRAFQLARTRRRKVTSVDKANVLETSRLWREVVTRIARSYPDVELNHLYVDSCAMRLIDRPTSFDVILTNNMFGDILSDEAAMLTGSIGLLPSASLGERAALYEPVHGSAPDIAGRNRANPVGAIASVALMMRHSFRMEGVAKAIETAIEKVLKRGVRTTLLVWLAILVLVIPSQFKSHATGPAGGAARSGRFELSSSDERLHAAGLVLLHGKIWTGEPYAEPGQKPVPTTFVEAVAM